MKKLEMLKRILEAKRTEVEAPVVYAGKIEGNRWKSESLEERYKDIVKIVEVIEDSEPEKAIEDYEFIGGNANRLVYIHKRVCGTVAHCG
jgi:hypothetical protein